jgi:hypothetical protein
MRSFPFRQRGVGFAGWLILILVFGGLLTVGTKLFPVYMDNNTMASLLDKMAEEDGMAEKPKSEIYKIVGNRFKLNNIRNFDVDRSIQVNRGKNGTSVILDYEVRVPVIANLDLIASFNKEVELRN